MTLKECYNKLNGNYEEALSRLMNETLMDRFVRKFPSDPSMQALLDKVAEGDWPEAFKAAHTLKGVAGNMSFTELQQSASALTEQMRGQNAPCDPELLGKVVESYEQVMQAIQAYTA